MKSVKFIITMILVSHSFALPVLAQPYGENYDAALAFIISDNKKTIKDAAWISSNTLKVSVIDNGTDRNGYASYICEELYGYGIYGTSVYIVDVVKLIRQNRSVNLGISDCKDNLTQK